MIFFSPLVKNKDQKAGEMAQQSRVCDALTQDSGSVSSIHKTTHSCLKDPFGASVDNAYMCYTKIHVADKN